MFHLNKKHTCFFRLSKIIIAVFIIFSMTGMVFSGCAGKKTENSDNMATTSTKRAAENETDDKHSQETDAIHSVTFWNSCKPKERIFLMENIESFKRENPNISIEVKHYRSEEELMDTFSAASLAGAGPDIILLGMNNMKKLVKENVLKDLTDEFDYNKFIPGLNELTFFDRKRYVVPFNAADFLLFFYNREIISRPPSNFEEVLTYTRENTDPAAGIYGFLLNAGQPEWVLPFMGGYLDWIYDYDSGSISLNNQSVQKTLGFLEEVYNVENIIPFDIDYEEINDSFKAGNTAMIINGSWAIEEYEEAGIDFGVSKIPKATGALSNPTPMVTGMGFMVNVNSALKNFEYARSFINYMISNEIQKAWMLNTSSYPSVTGLEREDIMTNDILYNTLLQVKICRGQIPEEDLRLVREVIKLNIESLIAGNISAEDAAVKMQEDIIKMKSGQLKIEDFTETTSGEEEIRGENG